MTPTEADAKTQTRNLESAPPEGLIDIHELAPRLKKTVRTVQNYQRNRLIPFVRIGRSVLFDWQQVRRHLAENYTIHPRTRPNNRIGVC